MKSSKFTEEQIALALRQAEAVYRRYAIVVESDLLAGGEKLADLHQIQSVAERSVLLFPQLR